MLLLRWHLCKKCGAIVEGLLGGSMHKRGWRKHWLGFLDMREMLTRIWNASAIVLNCYKFYTDMTLHSKVIVNLQSLCNTSIQGWCTRCNVRALVGYAFPSRRDKISYNGQNYLQQTKFQCQLYYTPIGIGWRCFNLHKGIV